MLLSPEFFIKAAQLLLSLSILIVLHELGHFIPAKLFGTRVEKFYLFFDVKYSLFKKKIGETVYGIGWLPLGGYVKISGMIDESFDKEQMSKPPQPWEFRSKPAWQRLIIMLGGVTVNLAVGFLIYMMVLFIWGKQTLPQDSIPLGMQPSPVVQKYGFEKGDKIVNVDGKELDNVLDINRMLLFRPIDYVTVQKTNGSTSEISIPSGLGNDIFKSGQINSFSPIFSAEIDSVIPDSPALYSGHQSGDKILSVNDNLINDWASFSDWMDNNQDDIINVTVEHQDIEYKCCPGDLWPNTKFSITLKRNPNKYVVSIIMAVFITFSSIVVNLLNLTQYRRTYILVFIPLTLIWLQIHTSSKVPVIEYSTKLENIIQLCFYTTIVCAFESGIKSTVPVTIACACAGIIIGSVFVSGLGLKFTQSVIDLSGGMLFPLLCLTAISAIILGMGMTTTAVYITVAALIVPSLIQAGVMPIAAHMFAFYFGVVSTITPPVALASFAGAAIAKSPPMSTAVESSKVGIAKYIVPFAFIYNPSLLMEGPTWISIYSLFSVLIAYWSMTLGLEGWFNGPLKVFTRIIAFASSVLLLIPPLEIVYGYSGFLLNSIGLLLLIVVYFIQGRFKVWSSA